MRSAEEGSLIRCRSTSSSSPFARAVSPFQEMGAYEAMWAEEPLTFKTMAERFANDLDCRPSDFVEPQKATDYANFVRDRFAEANVGRFGVRVNGAAEYPERLRDAAHPVELLYYVGLLGLGVVSLRSGGGFAGSKSRRSGANEEVDCITRRGRLHRGVWLGRRR